MVQSISLSYLSPSVLNTNVSSFIMEILSRLVPALQLVVEPEKNKITIKTWEIEKVNLYYFNSKDIFFVNPN